MSEPVRQLIQKFFEAIGRGDSLADLITKDMRAWTVDGRIASVAEFMNQSVVEEKVVPLITQALGSGNT